MNPSKRKEGSVETMFAELKKKCNVLYWFLLRPRFYGEFGRWLLRKVFYDWNVLVNQTSDPDWISRHVRPRSQVLDDLFDRTPPEAFEVRYEDVIDRSKRTMSRGEVSMGSGGDLDFLYWACEFLEVETVVETGVAHGWSSLALLCSLENRNGRLYSTNMPYPGVHRSLRDYVGGVVPEDLRNFWTIYHEPDLKILPELLEEVGSVDLCHYDSDKSYYGRIRAYPLLWEALRPGGIMVIDDVGEVGALETFCGNVNRTPLIIQKNFLGQTTDDYVGIIKK